MHVTACLCLSHACPAQATSAADLALAEVEVFAWDKYHSSLSSSAIAIATENEGKKEEDSKDEAFELLAKERVGNERWREALNTHINHFVNVAERASVVAIKQSSSIEPLEESGQAMGVIVDGLRSGLARDESVWSGTSTHPGLLLDLNLPITAKIRQALARDGFDPRHSVCGFRVREEGNNLRGAGL